MYWAEYLEEVIKEQKCLDNIKINIEDQTVELPKIVKASVFLLEKMIKNQGRNNIFVFIRVKLNNRWSMIRRTIINNNDFGLIIKSFITR